MKRFFITVMVLMLSGWSCVGVEVKGELDDTEPTAYILEEMAQESEWLMAMNVDEGRIVVRGPQTYILRGGNLKFIVDELADDEVTATVTGGKLLLAGDDEFLPVLSGTLTAKITSGHMVSYWKITTGSLIVSRNSTVQLQLEIETGNVDFVGSDLSLAAGTQENIFAVGAGRLNADVDRKIIHSDFPEVHASEFTNNIMHRQALAEEITPYVEKGLVLEGADGYIHINDDAMTDDLSDYRDYFQELVDRENELRSELYELFADAHDLDSIGEEVAELFGSLRIKQLAPDREYLTRGGEVAVKDSE